MTMPSNEIKTNVATRTSRRRKSRWSDALPRLLPLSAAAADRAVDSMVDFSKRLFARPTARNRRGPLRWSNRLTVVEPLEDRRLLALIGAPIVVSEAVDDIAYNAATGLIWATVPARNSIISIDPFTGAVSQDIFVGSMQSSDPNQIAVSDDGTVAWVGVNGANAVQFVDLTTRTRPFVTPPIQLGTDIAEDLEVLPNQAFSVGVARAVNTTGPGRSLGLEIYDLVGPTGIIRAGTTANGPNNFEFNQTGTEAYGYSNQFFSNQDINRYFVGAGGFTADFGVANLVMSSGEMKYSGGELFFNDGSIVNATTLIKRGTFNAPVNAPQFPEADADKSYFIDNNTIRIKDHNVFTEIYNVAIPAAAGAGSDPLRFGVDGLAFKTATQVILVRDDRFGFVIDAPNNDNVIRVVRNVPNGPNINVFIDGVLVAALDYATNAGIRINGGDANDDLIVDLSNGDVLQGIGIDFDADPNMMGGFSDVSLVGGTSDSAVFRPNATPGGGVINVSGPNAGTILYAGATSLSASGLGSLTYVSGGNADNLNFNNTSLGRLVLTGTSGGPQINPLVFTNVQNFTLDANAGGPDAINVNSAIFGLGPLQTFSVLTGTSDDSLSVDLPFTLAGASNFSWFYSSGSNAVTVNTPGGQGNIIDVLNNRIVTTNPVNQTINFLGSGDIAINVNAGSASDTFFVDDTFGADDTINLDAGSGDDFVNFGPTFSGTSAVSIAGGTGADTISVEGDFGVTDTVTVSGGDDDDTITFMTTAGPTGALFITTDAGDDMTQINLPASQTLGPISVNGVVGIDDLKLVGAVGIDDRLTVTPASLKKGKILESTSGTELNFINVTGDVVVAGQVGEDDQLTANARDGKDDRGSVRPDMVTGDSHQGRIELTTALIPVNFDGVFALTVNLGDEVAGGDHFSVQNVALGIPVTVNGGEPGNEALPIGDRLVVDRTGVTDINIVYTTPDKRNGTVHINNDPNLDITFTSIEGNQLCESIVTNTADSGFGSLRAALECIVGFPGLALTFEIPGAGPHTIMPLSPLPVINDKVIFDGTSQAGYVDKPIIEIDGSLAGPGANGLEIRGGEATIIKGVVINSFDNVGIVVSGTDGHTIDGNYIGTDLAGAVAKPNGTGILVQSSDNTIGTGADGNLISGNTLAGVRISGVATTGNNVWNNKIGTNASGTAALANNIGVEIVAGQNNLVGGTAASQRNVISGNALYGVWLRGDNNLVQGNFVGTNMAGSAAVANREGVLVTVSTGNVVGGTADGAGNLISGNSEAGIWLSGTRADGNFVEGNVIGLNAAGTGKLGNRDGVDIDRAPKNMIGGNADGAANVISGNKRNGISLKGATATGNIVLENMIGTNADGDTALGNRRGVLIDGAPANKIGDALTGELTDSGNLISGNTTDGVRLQSAGATGNLVQANRIGTSFDGEDPLPNNIGVQIRDGADFNLIGGDSTLKLGNLISANLRHGVALKEVDANLIYGNLIGTNRDGTEALGHGQDGVRIKKGSFNQVGGGGQGQGNVISASGDFGVRLGADNNSVQGNHIGTNVTGTRVLANDVGVFIRGAGNLIGGDSTAGQGNLISGNAEEGVWIDRGTSTGNMVRGNLIGTGVSGADAMPNKYGVRLTSGANGNMIGGDSGAGQGNTISGNTLHGVFLQDVGTSNNRVEGNNIGINQFAFAAVPNGKQGILIEDSDSNMIGGSAPGMGNLIAGNAFDGVKISGPGATGNMVQGNVIGRLDIPNRNGILVSDFAAGNMIGGVAPGESNTIAHNIERGVWINAKGGFSNGVRHNTIHDNGGSVSLGLDLSISGQTRNDTNDADKGPNKTQNFPEILSAKRRAPNIEITFLVDALPGVGDNRSNYGANGLEIEFYATDSNGQEGEVFLGQVLYPAANAQQPITVTVPAGPAGVGTMIVATATDADQNTSEFSDPKTVTNNLLAAGGPVSGNAAPLSAGELAPIVDLAIAQLESFGFAPDLFSTVDVTIADLPGAELGLAAATSITIDVNAAGYGWETNPKSEIGAPATAAHPQSMDLLTAVMHELGHVAGLDDLYDPAMESDLMYAFLRPGVRKTLTEASLGGAEVDLVFNDYE